MQIFLYFGLSKNSHVPPPEYLKIEPHNEVIGKNIGLIRLQLIYFCSDLSFNYCVKKNHVDYHPQLSVSVHIRICVGEGYCAHERAYAHLRCVHACLYLQLEDL